jgi:hypothetical protein
VQSEEHDEYTTNKINDSFHNCLHKNSSIKSFHFVLLIIFRFMFHS